MTSKPSPTGEDNPSSMASVPARSIFAAIKLIRRMLSRGDKKAGAKIVPVPIYKGFILVLSCFYPDSAPIFPRHNRRTAAIASGKAYPTPCQPELAVTNRLYVAWNNDWTLSSPNAPGSNI